MGEQNELTRPARAILVEAADAHIDAFDAWQGALCTAYVAIFEYNDGNGHRCCVWLTGNGADPKEGEEEGLDSWRVEGMVRKVLRDLDARNVTHDDE
jgi:hypothetical protein